MNKLLIKLKIEEIKEYDKNPRKNDSAVDDVAESIRQCGYAAPILIDENNIILAGHTRYKALKKLGYSEVEALRIEGMTEEQKKKYRLLDNKTNEKAEWDFDLLNLELLDLDFGGYDFGFGEFGEEKDPDKVIEDEVPATPKQQRAKRGDIYKLGNHRVMCGDGTDAADVSKLMDGESADLVLTDPPYNVAVGDKNKHLNVFDTSARLTENIANDAGMTDEECGEKLWKPAFENMRNFANDNCAIYCFMPQGGAHMMMMMMAGEAGWQVKHELIWVKSNHVLGFADYDYKHEPILYGWNKTHSFYATKHQVSVFEDKLDIDKMKKDEMAALLKELLGEKDPTSVIHESKPLRSELHPTMKPIKLLARLISNSSRQGELVLDLFGGSGSTLIACEQMNRRCNTMEIDPKYVDVIIERWEKFTGKQAELVTD